TRGAAHRADECSACLSEEVGSCRRRVGYRRIGRTTGVEHCDDRAETAVEVDPMVAVADRLVERGQRRGLCVNPSCRGAEPGVDAVERHFASSILCSSVSVTAAAETWGGGRRRLKCPSEGLPC